MNQSTQTLKRKSVSKTQRTAIASLTNFRCAYCGISLEKSWPLDQINPFFKGGLDEPENLIAACRSCNYYKATYTVNEFREQISKWTTRLQRDSVTFKNALRFGLIELNDKTPIQFYAEKIGLWT